MLKLRWGPLRSEGLDETRSLLVAGRLLRLHVPRELVVDLSKDDLGLCDVLLLFGLIVHVRFRK